MRFNNYINERIIDEIKLKKIKKAFENLPSSTPESVSKYIVNILKVSGVKIENKGYTYLSGPMTNLPDDNWPVFIYARKYLKGKVINPANPHGSIVKKDKSKFEWTDYMIEDVYDLVKCDKIVLLPGYSKSTGAQTEIFIGKKLLGIKPKEFKNVISKNQYKKFMEDVKKQYLKDGFKNEYYSIIEPMLTAKTEKEAAKYVKTFVPKKASNESILNENILDTIKDWSLKGLLKIIGIILKKNNIKNIIR